MFSKADIFHFMLNLVCVESFLPDAPEASMFDHNDIVKVKPSQLSVSKVEDEPSDQNFSQIITVYQRL